MNVTRRIKLALAVVLLISVGGSAYAFFNSRADDASPTIVTAAVTRGDVVAVVSATGTLQAVTSVQVGTQVSGTIQTLGADFNSIVKRGQVLARLDPALFQTQIEQARANLIRAEADVDRLQVALADARTKLSRTQELWNRELIARTELEAAEVDVRSAEAQIRSAEAQVTQARAALNQAEVNLQQSVIRSPIDGIVVARNVDVGQTVAAAMQAPTLFVLAADLGRMEVMASIDESDVGRIAEGQRVAFTVDAYPSAAFTGTVAQVRLQPQTVQNVVTYSALIDAPNPDLLLKPGMTANVTIEVARRDGVIKVPNAALTFRPAPSAVEGPAGKTGPRVWRSVQGNLTAVPVQVGLSDGQATEVSSSALNVGDQVAVRLSTPGQPTRPQAGSSPFQLMQPPGALRR
jgi:HlyD family secretion protein